MANGRTIPAGAIKIYVPGRRQPDSFSCGAGAAQMILDSFEIPEDDIEVIKQACGSDPNQGTYYKNMEKYLRDKGLDVSVRSNMTRDDLVKLIDERARLIVSIQAYAADPAVYDDPNNNTNGHYVVAVGYDSQDHFYFKDPSVSGITHLAWADLDKRWHENEGWDGKLEVFQHMCIVVKATDKVPDPMVMFSVAIN